MGGLARVMLVQAITATTVSFAGLILEAIAMDLSSAQ
jgi:hypothetical protein